MPDFQVHVLRPHQWTLNYTPQEYLNAPLAGGNLHTAKDLMDGCSATWLSPDGTLLLNVLSRMQTSKPKSKFTTAEDCQTLTVSILPPLLRALATEG